MFLPYESYNESDDKSDNDSDNKSNIISNQEQILDIRHEYSGTGMQKPNYLYAILFKYSFKLILWLNGMFYRHKKGSPSPNLMITNKILYYITRVSYSNTIKCHRQPMLGLLSPLLPNTALYSFNLTEDKKAGQDCGLYTAKNNNYGWIPHLTTIPYRTQFGFVEHKVASNKVGKTRVI